MTAHPTGTIRTLGTLGTNGAAETDECAFQPGITRQGGTRDVQQDVARHVLDEAADVRFLPSGTPWALRWRGSIWQVIGESLAWSSSSSWWEPNTTPLSTAPLSTAPEAAALDATARVSPRGGQDRTITTRLWRFQAQTGPSSPVLEFDMSAGPHQGGWRTGWRLRRVAGTTDY